MENINKLGNEELARMVRAMSEEEQRIVARNLPIYICLERIQKEVNRLHAIEDGVLDILDKWK